MSNFHRTRTSTIALILDTENWAPADVATEFQDIIYIFLNKKSKITKSASRWEIFFFAFCKNI